MFALNEAVGGFRPDPPGLLQCQMCATLGADNPRRAGEIRNLYSASEQIAKFNTDERDLELDDVIEMCDLVYFLKRN